MVFNALRAAAPPLVGKLTVLAMTAVLLSGCASVLTGTALRDPRVDPRAVNTAMLDPGPFPTKPAPALGVAGNERAGRTAESHRMTEVVLLPFEIDSTVTEQDQASGPFTNADELGVSFALGFFGVGPHDMIAASRSLARRPRSVTRLGNAVLRFTAPEEAAGAADYMASHTVRDAITFDSGTTSPARRPLPLPDRPETKAVRADHEGWSDVYTYTAYGPYVLVQTVSAETGDAALGLALTAIDKQRPTLDGFAPTPVDQLTSLPVDPTGLLARSLPAPAGTDNSRFGVYGPHGALNFMSSPHAPSNCSPRPDCRRPRSRRCTSTNPAMPRARPASPTNSSPRWPSVSTAGPPSLWVCPRPAACSPPRRSTPSRRRPTTACWPPTATSSKRCPPMRPTPTRRPSRNI